MNPDDYQFEVEDSLGKKRKHTAWMTGGQEKASGSLFQCYYNVSSDGKVFFKSIFIKCDIEQPFSQPISLPP